MIPKISVCCYVKNNDSCGFGLWESMASLIPFADEYIILDCGSSDGTLETLKDLAVKNPKIRLEQGSLTVEDGSADARAFATKANDLVAMAKNDLVLYHQADEIWHDDLLTIMRSDLVNLAGGVPADWNGMSFWRYQLTENLQVIKWWPHLVNRLDRKERMNFVGDGMNTDRALKCDFVAGYKEFVVGDGDPDPWQINFRGNPSELPTNHMILDISATGMFVENIVTKRHAHAPYWHESPDTIRFIDGSTRSLQQWMGEQYKNPNWFKSTTPFDVPSIIKELVGKDRYFARDSVLQQIANG